MRCKSLFWLKLVLKTYERRKKVENNNFAIKIHPTVDSGNQSFNQINQQKNSSVIEENIPTNLFPFPWSAEQHLNPQQQSANTKFPENNDFFLYVDFRFLRKNLFFLFYFLYEILYFFFISFLESFFHIFSLCSYFYICFAAGFVWNLHWIKTAKKYE